MNTLLSTLLLFFLLISPIHSQIYQFDTNFLEALRTGSLDPNNVENLTIASNGIDPIMLDLSADPKDYLNIFGTLKKLKVIQFEKLRLTTSIDSLSTFDPMTFEESIRIVHFGLEVSSYGVLSFLDAFEDLEILELNFLDNEGFYTSCRRDFSWAVLSKNIEQEMALELFDCLSKDSLGSDGTMPEEQLSMWNWIEREEGQLELMPPFMELEEWPKKQSQMDSIINDYPSNENPWESEQTISDEEYCDLFPDLCDDAEIPFWNLEDEEGIDTAFLIEIGAWPLEEEPIDTNFLIECGVWSSEEKEEKEVGMNCWWKVYNNPIWQAYQTKCAELHQLCLLKEGEGIEGLYQKLSMASQTLVDQKTEASIPVSSQKKQRSLWIQKLYYKELWETLRPWSVKTRSELLLEQLSKLKKLKKLSISNNYMLDLEALIAVIVTALPNLEVLEIKDCQIFNIPDNINELKQLSVLQLDHNFIQNAAIIQLPNLAILSLKDNPVSEQTTIIIKEALPNCSIRFYNTSW